MTVWSPLSLLYATGSRHGEVAVWSRPFHSAVVNCRINDPSDESSILKLVWCDAHESGSQNLLAVATESRKVYIWSLFRKVSNYSHRNIFEFWVFVKSSFTNLKHFRRSPEGSEQLSRVCLHQLSFVDKIACLQFNRQGTFVATACGKKLAVWKITRCRTNKAKKQVINALDEKKLL